VVKQQLVKVSERIVTILGWTKLEGSAPSQETGEEEDFL
jgi:hypothetical protein